MTQKEINKFLANTKVYVAGKSKEIQEKLFSLGYKWLNKDTEVRFTESPFLYIFTDMTITKGIDMVVFSNHENREISAEEILSLELTEPAYRPFKDKDECWQEMLKHQPFGWTKHIESQIYANCGYVGNDGIDTASYEDAHKYYTFADGTPFGVKED